MKPNKNIILTNFMICILVVMSCNSEKEKTELSPFNIQVVKTEEEIKLKCTLGCAWTELNFTKNNYQAQFVDEFGMSDSKDRESEKTDDNLANFIFSISKTEEGIQLIGEQGTAWKELNFSLKNYEPQIITQTGMKE